MRIDGVDLWIVTIPHPEPVTWAGVVESSAQSVLLRVRTDAGPSGLAQARLHPAWSGTTPRLTAQALHELYTPLVLGANPLAAQRIQAAIDRVRGWSPAKSLLECALTDLRARLAGLPLRTYLGGWSDEARVAAVVTRGPAGQRVDELGKAVARYGFTAVKVKIGTDVHQDIALVHEIRATFGPEPEIRVDANSGYSLADALFAADAFAEAGVAHFEDPCPLEPPAARREVFRRSRVPVLADRVVDSEASARRVIADGASAVSVKVQRVGFGTANRIRQVCEDENVPAVTGLSGEAVIGALAGLQLHAAYRHFTTLPAEESYFAALPHDVVSCVPEIRDGKIVLPDAPGLGVELDPEALAAFGVRYPG
ncbi:mandelate racemase/muconate lactonizing enzyme family protein [Amycolatopsis pithecellobii]|uniref:Mandelate racemase/muconate lactonizing enzyme C-terminal domain-containing protein n=1 Tax=Amycolatopsis pithecellobii TaxID=664692 RepID=A0A6N7YWD2_9PSEU|nr:mandelate racemase/muconate lactonizing enzyme family protein [Amycolatopsis pithecellobii]MTD53183.1 hypothetical protein [Amycolatopsis pithecellobii]